MEGVVRQHITTPITDVTHIPSGVNEVFLITCMGERVIARFNAASELGRFQKEAWCIDRAAAVGVEGPRVLAVGSDAEYAFMVESYVPGRRGDTVLTGERDAMWRDLGGYLRRIHGISVRGFGEELMDLTDDDGGVGWRRYLEYNISSLDNADPLLEKGVLDVKMQSVLRGAFDRLARAPLRFGLSHGDPSPTNVILGDEGVLHVLDWSEAHAHIVPHYDFGVILNDRLLDEDAPEFQALLGGYELARTDYAAIRQEVMDLGLLVATDKLRWALDRKPDRFDAKVNTLQTWLRRYEFQQRN